MPVKNEPMPPVVLAALGTAPVSAVLGPTSAAAYASVIAGVNCAPPIASDMAGVIPEAADVAPSPVSVAAAAALGAEAARPAPIEIAEPSALAI